MAHDLLFVTFLTSQKSQTNMHWERETQRKRKKEKEKTSLEEGDEKKRKLSRNK